MTAKPNPDIYRPMAVPQILQPYVRRAMIADTSEMVDMLVDVRATGYHYFGWIWRGSWQGMVNGEIRFDSDIDGRVHLSGQVINREVVARMQRDVGQIFLEFTALGHFQLLGLTGEQMLEDAQAPQVLNPALKSHLDKLLLSTENLPAIARMELMADVLSQMPKQPIPAGIETALKRIEAVDGNIRISDLMVDLGLAERKFRTDFKLLIGLTPKAFCKTLQINLALNQLLMNNGGDLAGVAAQTGFSDQAHFTRAFRDYLGKAPREYLGDVEVTLARFVGQSRQ